MVVGVVRRPIDNWFQKLWYSEVSVVYADSPNVDRHVEKQVGELVHGEAESVDVVRHTLQEAIDGVKCVAGERGGHLPSVVIFVEMFVDGFMMKSSVDPINEKICECDEGQRREENHVPAKMVVMYIVI